MKYRLLQWLACPSCRGPNLTVDTLRTETKPVCIGHFEPGEEPPGVDLDRQEEREVLEGALHCSGCGAVYPIRGGIPRMLPADVPAGPSTRHHQTDFDTGIPEWEKNFLDLAAPLGPPDFLGRLVLDAGCGFGRHAYFAARYGAEVIALDSSVDAIEAARRNVDHLARAHVVQGDIYHPPFADGIFDMTYSFGVLHHLEDPSGAFEVLGQTVKPGGRLSLWVYGPRQGATLAVNNALRGVTTGLDGVQLEWVSRMIARGLRVFSHTPYRLLAEVPIARTVVSHLPVHDHHRWPFPVVVADIYDRLRIPVRHWFTGEELEGWLTRSGYANVQVTRRVGNNETFCATGVRR